MAESDQKDSKINRLHQVTYPSYLIQHEKPAKPVPKGYWQNYLDNIGAEVIINQILNGESLRAIARSYGMAFGTLFNWLFEDSERSARARKAMEDSALAFDEIALEVIELATTPMELARARELAHHLRWRASKRNSKVFGDKQHVEINQTVNVNVALVEARQRVINTLRNSPVDVIEHEPTDLISNAGLISNESGRDENVATNQVPIGDKKR